jgi:hypothetical protein
MASANDEPMRALFDGLAKDGAPAVRGLLGRMEDVDFDCKRKADPTTGGASKGDREVLGRTLSALANSMGGLLLWGVDARQDAKTKIDAVCDFIPIADIDQFKSEMVRLADDALMPRLSVRQAARLQSRRHSNELAG